jgi:hypothetical protein
MAIIYTIIDYISLLDDLEEGKGRHVSDLFGPQSSALCGHFLAHYSGKHRRERRKSSEEIWRSIAELAKRK